ncbi:hypothetical protein C4K39_4429 [Pseudomonas sessilinigenes]|nr:hypothetical protein C4K39_4429 [Pseudomonas sessilinigenes]
MKPWLRGLAYFALLLLSDCGRVPPASSDEPPRHWCVHELHRALGKFFFPSTS